MFVSETLTARRSWRRATARQALLAEPLGLAEVALVLGHQRQVGEQGGDAGLVAEGLAQREAGLVRRSRLVRMPLLGGERAAQVQHAGPAVLVAHGA